MGEHVSRKDLELYALSGLNHRYNSFICYITEHAGTVTIEEFHSRFLVFKNRLKQQDKYKENKVLQTYITKFNKLNVLGSLFDIIDSMGMVE